MQKKGKKFTCGAPLIPEGLLNGGMKWKTCLFFGFYGMHRVVLNAWEMKEGYFRLKNALSLI